jgi:hypothetical protein
MKLARLVLSLLLLATGALISSAQGPDPSTHEWRASQETDARTGGSYTQLLLAGRFLSRPSKGSSDRPTVSVRCNPEEAAKESKEFTAGSIRTGAGLKIDYVEPEEIHGTSYFPKVTVHYRMDDAKEHSEQWAPGADKTSVSIPKDVLNKMLHAHTVLVTVRESSGTDLPIQFDMPPVTQLETACTANEHKK